MEEKMRVLLSNDDGIDAPGIAALIRALSKRHTLYVVAPDRPQSSVSRKVSIGTPLHPQKRVLSEFPQVWAYALDGTPVDCVRVALGNLLPVKPDLCVTGINFGYNIGTDTLYSGTCAAAIEAAVNGVPAIAMSCGVENGGAWMDTAGEIALGMTGLYKKHPLTAGAFYNVNVPDLPLAQIKGVRQAELSRIPYDLPYEKVENETDPYIFTKWTKAQETNPNTDRSLAYASYVAVSVLTYGHAHNEMIGNTEPEEWVHIGGRRCE